MKSLFKNCCKTTSGDILIRDLKIAVIMIVYFIFSIPLPGQTDYLKRGSPVYDFSFIELSINYLETVDTAILIKIAATPAATHLLNHARKYNPGIPCQDQLQLVKYLLNPVENYRNSLKLIRRNLAYAKESLASTDIVQKTCLMSLPAGFKFNGSLFFTCGYDYGVVYDSNASINLAHPHFLADVQEIKYYAIHELHHAGFMQLRQVPMPGLDIHSFKEMAELIEFFTQLEGMAVFAAWDIRARENAMNRDKDYIALQDTALMKESEREYFEIYFHFKNNPGKQLTDKDWSQLNVLSDEKRLWYRVGAWIARKIDQEYGRETLVGLISGPSENFIRTYLSIKK
jgi:hypothetical protein